MSSLTEQHCKPCDGGVQPLSPAEAERHMQQLDGWQLSADAKLINRGFKFKNFYHTMSFVNAVAYIANREDHHPDLQVGYDYCRIEYSTHAIKGLSINDFICAAKIDALGK
jgi:4a-hydroxytetrahydrobiopterin dehydratase